MKIVLKKIYLLLFIYLFFFTGNMLLADEVSSYKNLMPVPAKVKKLSGNFRVDSSFTIGVSGKSHHRLYKAVGRMVKRLAGRTGLFLPQVFFNPTESPAAPEMVIKTNRPGFVRFGEEESYHLLVTKEKIILSAETDIGAIRGMETFLQLLDADRNGYFIPAVEINDTPRFLWRGLLIDACRHFIPVEVIKRNLNAMAAVKLNVLHWHLTEDQGFRVECKAFPKLYKMGSDGLYYTQEQVKEIIRYADDRGIRVIPEFDVPGHATSWLVGYPELASAPGPYKIERRWGIMDPTFNPAIEETYKFFDAFFKEMSALFPDEYIHIGGDENKGKQWDANPQIQAFKKAKGFADNKALQNYFNQRLLVVLKKYGKKMIGWDEILHKDMPKDIVLQSWRGRQAMIKAAQRGYNSLLSNGYYIDLNQPANFHYLNDPLPENSPLTKEQKKHILGGEATMWTEFVSPEIIDSRIWPRTAAIAERFWSPSSVRDVDDMYRRLKIISFQLEELGLTHKKNYAMMLRRLTGNQDTKALKTLIDVIEPVKIYARNQQRTHYSYSPLTRVVDAARPDAETARNFRNLVNAFIEERIETAGAEIKSWLLLWKDNHKQLKPVISASPILFEIEKMSENLSSCAVIGLEAMKYIQEKKKANDKWLLKSKKLIEQAKMPCAQTELMIVPAIEALLEFVESGKE